MTIKLSQEKKGSAGFLGSPDEEPKRPAQLTAFVGRLAYAREAAPKWLGGVVPEKQPLRFANANHLMKKPADLHSSPLRRIAGSLAVPFHKKDSKSLICVVELRFFIRGGELTKAFLTTLIAYRQLASTT